MGRINQLCNMEKSEADAYLKEFQPYFVRDEEECVSDVFNHYLFYESFGRRDYREFTCTHVGCGSFSIYKEEDPDMFKHTHGDIIDCPICGGEVKLVALGKMRSFATLEEKRRIVLCRTGSNGALLLIAGWAVKKYSWNDLRPIVWFQEKRRYCLLPGKRMQWTQLRGWNGWRYTNLGWSQDDFVKEPFNPYMYISDGSYQLIGTENIYNSALKYCQVSEWYHHETHVDVGIDDMKEPVRQVVRYLSAYTQYPTIEMAEKIGLYDGVSDLVMCNKKNAKDLDWNAKSIAGLLRLSKPDAKLFVARRYNLKLLHQYHSKKKLGKIKKLEDLDVIVQAAGGIDNVPMLTGCAKMAGCSLKQAINYLDKQDGGKRRERTLTMWKDYMDMAEKLQYDTARKDVIMPRDLIQRHDNAAEAIAIQKAAEKRAEYSQRLKNLQSLYYFWMDGLCIRVPESAEEIVAEGKALQHCVGGYAARHMKGTVDILFLRKIEDPDTPYLTIEMIPRKYGTDKVKMVQIHGFKNEVGQDVTEPRKRHELFLKTWEAWMRKGSPRDGKGIPVIRIMEEKTA